MITGYVNTIYGRIIENMEEGLGAYIKRKRLERGLTQAEIARRVQMDRAYLSQIESGGVARPNAMLRKQIADALGVRHVDMLVAAGELYPDDDVS